MPQRTRWSDADLMEAIAAEHSWRGVMLRLGYATASGSGFRLVKVTEGEIKLFEVSTGIFNLGRAAILAEVAKCDVICANCHRIRTATRGGWAELSQ